MNCNKLFNTIKKEGFDEELALLTTIAQALLVSMPVEGEDMIVKGRFQLRMEELVRSTLWEHHDRIEEVITLGSVLYEYDLRTSMDGIGGCKKTTLKDLYEKAWVAKRKPVPGQTPMQEDPPTYPPMDTEVIINLNDEAGEVQYSVAYRDNPGDWIDSFPTYKEAMALVNSKLYKFNPKEDFINSLTTLGTHQPFKLFSEDLPYAKSKTESP